MKRHSFKRHGFPPDVIRVAVGLYFGFTVSGQDVEEMLAQRGCLGDCSVPYHGALGDLT